MNEKEDECFIKVPMSVLRDERLSANEKLLLAEIISKTNFDVIDEAIEKYCE